MADVPVGAVPAPESTAAPAVAAKPNPRETKLAKIAKVNAGLTQMRTAAEQSTAEQPAASVETATEGLSPNASTSKPAETPSTEAAPAKPVEAEPEPDAQTKRGLALIDKRMAEFRDTMKAERAKFDEERAEFIRERTEWKSKGSSIEELQKLADVDPLAALERLGIKSDDETRWEQIGRAAFPRTKAGKADPNARKEVAQSQRERELMSQLDELKKGYEELRNEFKTRDERQTTQQFIEQYAEKAVKAIPADKPSLIGKLHAKSPDKAKQALLALGAEMERSAMQADGATKYDPMYTPSHAEVISEYEKRRRAELEDQGVDVDALLKPAASAPKQAPSKTLDPTATNGVRPVSGQPTRADKIKTASVSLHKLWSEQQ